VLVSSAPPPLPDSHSLSPLPRLSLSPELSSLLHFSLSPLPLLSLSPDLSSLLNFSIPHLSLRHRIASVNRNFNLVAATIRNIQLGILIS
ncbi:unnamed protein product, partial [Arabidopsis halleri]